jgi:EAL domain-containing protein (putative c-di-GMP-specific phosphodiesterase class I)
MLHQFATPFALEDRLVAVTASIGVALVQPHHLSAADVTRDACAAVHRAKTTGAARCALFDDEMHEASIGQLRLAAELRHALDRGEFRMHYQPIIGCATGRLSSMEALIRWQHPIRGCLLPADFLGALDNAGLMSQVGQWVIDEVCRQAVEWRDGAGMRVPIAINVSPRQLADPGFLTRLLESIRDAGACPESVAFEVTEDIELGKGESALRALRAIRGAGFQVRIDDFGTGYSSLSYLQRLPIDGLKIDRAFIHHLDHDSRRREIVSAIISLAHALDLDVVAEGVERREQLDILRALGCDRAQGYLLCHPLTAADALDWLQRHG